MAVSEYYYTCKLCGKRHRQGSYISAKHKREMADNKGKSDSRR